MQKSLAEWASGHGVTYSPAAFTPQPEPDTDVADPARSSTRSASSAGDTAPHHPPNPPDPDRDAEAEAEIYLNS